MAQRERVAIVAYTQHQQKAPWKDDSFELWGLNDLYGTFEQFAGSDIWTSNRVRWFQLHRPEVVANGQPYATGARDPNHAAWLKQAKCPIYFWEPPADVPTAQKFPMVDVLNLRGPRAQPRCYFNNTISWMIALAILEGFKTIGIYGVDMATDGLPGGGEYAHQRPSCEYYIGLAEGLGIEVLLPDESELLKCPYLYGWDNVSYLRTRLMSRHQVLVEQEAGAVNDYEATKRALHEIRGAKTDVEWMMRNWWPGEGQTQDVLRTPRSVIATLEPAAPAGSDGKDQPMPQEPVNRLAEVVPDAVG